MRVVTGTYHEGQVVLDSPVDWPDGARVNVATEETVGLSEADWPRTPEELDALVARFAALEPLEITPEEEAEIAAARAEVRRVTIEAVRKKMGLQP